jgi:hypothetical protein
MVAAAASVEGSTKYLAGCLPGWLLRVQRMKKDYQMQTMQLFGLLYILAIENSLQCFSSLRYEITSYE